MVNKCSVCKIKYASFNVLGETKGIKCKGCADADPSTPMVNVTAKKCATENCNKQPTYNISTEKSPLYCAQCAKGKPDMEKKGITLCAFKDCKITPVFNKPGEKRGKYCSKHQEPGMMNVIDDICTKPNCTTLARFNYPGSKKGVYCGDHYDEGMINLKAIICKSPDCKISASYNYPDKKCGIYCSKHHKPGMVPMGTRRCLGKDDETPCYTRPTYNFEGNDIPLYCKPHRKDGMINVKSKRCIDPDCNKTPNYNFTGSRTALYCFDHCEDGMIDIKSDFCIEPKCNTRASYNIKGAKKGLYCEFHGKPKGMVNVKAKKCEEKDCEIIPTFNYKGETKPTHCEHHGVPKGMINIVGRRCLTENCDTIVQNKYKGYCLPCFIHVFPDEPVVRNYKTKQRAVEDFIKEALLHLPPNVKITYDKKVVGGISRRRPDVYIDLGDQIIMIEIDENSHQTYDCSCENKRIMQLSQDIQHRNLILIRFNPDDYINNTGKKIKSCWTLDGLGIAVVKKDTQKEWRHRLNSLKTQIEYWIENRTDKTVEIIQMFYDQELDNDTENLTNELVFE